MRISDWSSDVCSSDLHPRWSGQCSDCGEWNSIAEDATAKSTTFSAKHDLSSGGTKIVMKTLNSLVEMPPRMSTGLGELGLGLGGGIVHGRSEERRVG